MNDASDEEFRKDGMRHGFSFDEYMPSFKYSPNGPYDRARGGAKDPMSRSVVTWTPVNTDDWLLDSDKGEKAVFSTPRRLLIMSGTLS